MTNTPISFSLILPCYNEEGIIEKTIRSTLEWASQAAVDFELIVVDDGSADRSAAILQKIAAEDGRIRVIRHEHNQGYANAIRTGIDCAIKTYAGFMDSDGQFSAEDFSLLIPLLQEADFVSGVRTERADPGHRKMNSAVYNFVIRTVFGVTAADIDCGMKIFKRSIWPSVRPTIAHGPLLNGELYLHLKERKICQRQIPVRHFPRTTGKATGAAPRVILRAFYELFLLLCKHTQFKLTYTDPRPAAAC